jgi:hypothetical protein
MGGWDSPAVTIWLQGIQIPQLVVLVQYLFRHDQESNTKHCVFYLLGKCIYNTILNEEN